MTRYRHVTSNLTNSQKGNCETFKKCTFHCFKRGTQSIASAKQDKAKPQSLGSGVWKLFVIVEGDNSKALCKVWQEEKALVAISRGGKQSRQLTATNLLNHVRKHPNKFLDVAANDKNQKNKERTEMNTDVFVRSAIAF